MRIRGYVLVGNDGSHSFLTSPKDDIGYVEKNLAKIFTFEIDVPHALPELKVIPESVEEVKDAKS